MLTTAAEQGYRVEALRGGAECRKSQMYGEMPKERKERERKNKQNKTRYYTTMAGLTFYFFWVDPDALPLPVRLNRLGDRHT